MACPSLGALVARSRSSARARSILLLWVAAASSVSEKTSRCARDPPMMLSDDLAGRRRDTASSERPVRYAAIPSATARPTEAATYRGSTRECDPSPRPPTPPMDTSSGRVGSEPGSLAASSGSVPSSTAPKSGTRTSSGRTGSVDMGTGMMGRSCASGSISEPRGSAGASASENSSLERRTTLRRSEAGAKAEKGESRREGGSGPATCSSATRTAGDRGPVPSRPRGRCKPLSLGASGASDGSARADSGRASSRWRNPHAGSACRMASGPSGAVTVDDIAGSKRGLRRAALRMEARWSASRDSSPAAARTMAMWTSTYGMTCCPMNRRTSGTSSAHRSKASMPRSSIRHRSDAASQTLSASVAESSRSHSSYRPIARSNCPSPSCIRPQCQCRCTLRRVAESQNQRLVRSRRWPSYRRPRLSYTCTTA
mmetsp:Transcript_1582/g.6329  ORF Transcript_1582/g.6329 Transcript_1582/m.6329 type:complete len:428 (-) Transcript_1582:764-2047(-)